MRGRAVLIVLLSAAVLALVASGQVAASPGTLVVDDDGIQCPNADFLTADGIQLAVTAASPGDRIEVCPGTYNPTVVDKPLLTLIGRQGRGQATNCQEPLLPDPTKDVIVQGAGPANVTITADAVTLDGFRVMLNSVGSGILVSGTTSGHRISHNVVELNTNGGMDLNTSGALATLVDHNCFRSNGPGSPFFGVGIFSTTGVANARITENYFTGHRWVSVGLAPITEDPIPTPTVNVTIDRNNVVDDATMGTSAGSNVVISHNRFLRPFGVAILTLNTSPAEISFNSVEGGTIVSRGIRVNTLTIPVPQVTIRGNHIADLLASVVLGNGITLGGGGISVLDNSVENSRGSGILLRAGSSGDLVQNNHLAANGVPGGDQTDGIRVENGASGNFIIGNHLRLNVDHDCHDDGPKDNVWEKNKGETENQPGLCR